MKYPPRLLHHLNLYAPRKKTRDISKELDLLKIARSWRRRHNLTFEHAESPIATRRSAKHDKRSPKCSDECNQKSY